jgi:hypothetical protein
MRAAPLGDKGNGWQNPILLEIASRIDAISPKKAQMTAFHAEIRE